MCTPALRSVFFMSEWEIGPDQWVIRTLTAWQHRGVVALRLMYDSSLIRRVFRRARGTENTKPEVNAPAGPASNSSSLSEPGITKDNSLSAKLPQFGCINRVWVRVITLSSPVMGLFPGYLYQTTMSKLIVFCQTTSLLCGKKSFLVSSSTLLELDLYRGRHVSRP